MQNATLKRIEAKIKSLTKRSDALNRKARQEAIATIVNQMHAYGVSLEDLKAAWRDSRTGASLARSPRRYRETAPKYQHPRTGETWSGRGRPPRWLVEAETEGAVRQSFLIIK